MKTKKILSDRFRLIGLLISVGALFFLAMVYLVYSQYKVYLEVRHRELHIIDRERIDKFLKTIEDIYASSGHLVRTTKELEATAYYPFEQSFSISLCTNATIGIHVSSKPNMWDETTLTSFYREKGQIQVMKKVQITVLSSESLTKLRIQTCLQGVSKRTQKVLEIRNRLIQQINDSFLTHKRIYHTYPFHLTERAFPVPPFSHDYPRNQKELTSYLQWIKQVEGLNDLNDGWDQPLRFSVDGNEFTGRSRGKDKRWHTYDDIIIRIKIHPSDK